MKTGSVGDYISKGRGSRGLADDTPNVPDECCLWMYPVRPTCPNPQSWEHFDPCSDMIGLFTRAFEVGHLPPLTSPHKVKP